MNRRSVLSIRLAGVLEAAYPLNVMFGQFFDHSFQRKVLLPWHNPQAVISEYVTVLQIHELALETKVGPS